MDASSIELALVCVGITSKHWIISTESWCGYLEQREVLFFCSDEGLTLETSAKIILRGVYRNHINFQLLQSIVTRKCVTQLYWTWHLLSQAAKEIFF